MQLRTAAAEVATHAGTALLTAAGPAGNRGSRPGSHGGSDPRYAFRRKESALIYSSAGGHGTFDAGNHFIRVRHLPIGPATCIHH
jgi:hypothetical protein